MTSMKQKVILFFSIVFLCSTVHADTIDVLQDTKNMLILRVQTSYIFGDGDTRVDAKNIALQSAKKLAAEKAGSYVQAERVIQDDEIKKDSIIMVSTALMAVEIKSEKLSITKEQQTKIVIVIEARLDKNSILAKLGILKENIGKKKQVFALQKENTSLRKELLTLNSKLRKLKTNIKSSRHMNKRTDLIERRDVVLSKLETNESSVRKVFERGTLFSMAKKSSVASDKAKRDIEFGIWGFIKNNTKINLGEPEFQDNNDGTYNIRVSVKWNMNGQSIVNTLNKYFRGYSGKSLSLRDVDFSDHMGKSVPGVKIKKYHNQKADQLLPYTFELYKFLLKKQANIVVYAGNYSSKITIATSRNCSVSCGSTQGDSQYQIHFNNQGKPKSIIFGYSQQNPLVIENVPEAVLQSLINIDAKVEII